VNAKIRTGRVRFWIPKGEIDLAKVDRAEPNPVVEPPPPPLTAAPRPVDQRLKPPPSKNLSIEDLIEYWKGVKAFGRRLSAYLYRRYPIVNLRKDDPAANTNIAILTEPPDSKDVLLREYGTGEYKLILNDLDRRGRNGELAIAIWAFSESWVDYPPILNYEMVDQGHPRNRAYVEWLKNTGKLPNMSTQQNGTGTADASAVQGLLTMLQTMLHQSKTQGGGTDAAFAKSIEMLGTANSKSLEMALAQVKQNGPTEMVELISKLQGLFHQPAPPDSTAKLLELLLKTQGDSQKALSEASAKNTELLLKLIETKLSGNGSGGLKGVQEMAEAFTALRTVFGGDAMGARPSGKWWNMFEQYIPQAIGVVDKAVSFLPFAFGRRNQPGAQHPQAQAPGFPPPPVQALPGIPAQEFPTTEVPAPVPAPNGATGPQMEEVVMKLSGFLNLAWRPMMKLLNGGLRGEMFGDWIEAGFGLSVSEHAEIKGQINALGGPPGLMRFVQEQAQRNPASPWVQAWNDVLPIQPQFLGFIEEFLEWSPGWAQQVEEAPPPEAGTPLGRQG